MLPDDIRPLTTSDLAAIFNVHRNTIARWMRNGRLPYIIDEHGQRVATMTMLAAHQDELGRVAARNRSAA